MGEAGEIPVEQRREEHRAFLLVDVLAEVLDHVFRGVRVVRIQEDEPMNSFVWSRHDDLLAPVATIGGGHGHSDRPGAA